MGIYDRDYFRNPPARSLGSFSVWSVTTWLIIINIAIFILDQFLPLRIVIIRRGDFLLLGRTHWLESFGSFSVQTAVWGLELWRIATYQFLHANLNHLLGNMLGLFFFGPIVESYWGPRRFLAFYLFCGMSGAVVFTGLMYAGLPIASPYSPLVGASAGIFGVLVAAAMIAPNMQVMFLLIPVPMQLKFLALIMLGIAAFTTITSGYNAGGEAAHLGGAALGFVFMRFTWLLRPFDFAWLRRKRMRARFTDWSKEMNR